jgi:hypothetical protein
MISVWFQRYLGSVLGYMAKYEPNLFAAWQNSDELLITWQNRYLPLQESIAASCFVRVEFRKMREGLRLRSRLLDKQHGAQCTAAVCTGTCSILSFLGQLLYRRRRHLS